MLDAADARNKAEVILGVRFASILEFAQDKVNEAVTEGKMHVTYSTSHDSDMRHYLKETLQKLGYKVAYSAQYNDESVTIDWSVPYQR